jgi:hypothetical protein
MGLDCAGMLVKVFHEAGLTDEDFTAYSRRSNYQQFVAMFDAFATRVPKTFVQPGMAVVIPCGGTPHCGLIAGTPENLTLIHAYAARKAVLEEPYTAHWRAACKLAYALPGVDY